MTYRELYEKALDDLEHNKITLGEFEERVKPLNQEPTSVIEELEKIKEEIKDLLFSYGYLDIHTNNDVLEIIENRISELKGE